MTSAMIDDDDDDDDREREARRSSAARRHLSLARRSSRERRALCGRASSRSWTFDATDARRRGRRALELAATATAAEVFPNPLVGCVVVDAQTDGSSEGIPSRCERTSEVFALRAARRRRAGGGPRYHDARTVRSLRSAPPCARALVDAARVARVVVGFVDDRSESLGGGARTRADAGVGRGGRVRGGGVRAPINADFIERQLARSEMRKSKRARLVAAIVSLRAGVCILRESSPERAARVVARALFSVAALQQ